MLSLRLLCVVIIMISSNLVLANDNGERIFQTTCQSCHGNEGAKLPSPILHGQEVVYLKKALNDFKSDTRIDQTMHAMNGIAKNLTDADIEDVASYLAGKDPCQIDMEIDYQRDGFMEAFKDGKEKISQYNCMHCHESFHHMAPRLLGQKLVYLEKNINDFKSGARTNPYMSRFMAKVEVKDIPNMALYLNAMRLMRTCE